MHDRYGKPLSVGDRVIISGTVKMLMSPETPNEYCNVQVETEVPMAGTPYTITLNAKQTEKVSHDSSGPADTAQDVDSTGAA